MNLTRYEPKGNLSRLHDEMDRMFKSMESSLFPFGDEESSIVTSQWAPAVDIKEENDKFLIQADIPGVDPKDIDVTMENGVLTIKGERKLEKEEERQGYKRIERSRGTFYRRFSLPDSADGDKISARSHNGVLELSIPKREVARPRKITIED